MSKEKQPCEAEVHADGCQCQKCKAKWCAICQNITLDHFTGKAIGTALGWTAAEINADSNKQYLSRACHRAKDDKTRSVLKQLYRQKRGGFIGLGQHVKIGVDD